MANQERVVSTIKAMPIVDGDYLTVWFRPNGPSLSDPAHQVAGYLRTFRVVIEAGVIELVPVQPARAIDTHVKSDELQRLEQASTGLSSSVKREIVTGLVAKRVHPECIDYVKAELDKI